MTYHQAKDKQLRDPYVGVIVQQHVESGAGVLLTEQITCRGKDRRNESLLLSVNNGKQQHIQQIEIQVGKILASRRAVIQHEKRNEQCRGLQIRKHNFYQKLHTVPGTTQEGFLLRAKGIELPLVGCDFTGNHRHALIGMVIDLRNKFRSKALLGQNQPEGISHGSFLYGYTRVHAGSNHISNLELIVDFAAG